MLNKQTVTLAVISLLWFAPVEVALSKRAAGGGGGGSMERGIQLAQQKQYDAAIVEFTKAIQANPRDLLGYANRATAYRASGRFAEAVADFSKVIELAPKDQMAYRERG